jgi:hypothetical protein
MERKIGETFEFKGKTYEVVELPEYFCAFCDLEKECYSKRSYLEKVTGTCSPNNRKDTRSVCFKEIKKDMEIKDNQLTINIPDGMEIDVENCDFDTGVIKFRKKELRYEDIENSLDLEGNRTGIPVDDKNAFKLCATDRLMNIARYYNGDWKPDWKNPDSLKFSIWYDTLREKYDIEYCGGSVRNDVYFKNKNDAQAAIDNPNFRKILDAIFKN